MSSRRILPDSPALTNVPVDALLVIDMQNGFLKGQENLVEKISDLVKPFPSERTWWLKYRNYPDSPFIKRLYWSEVMVPPQTDIDPSLRPFALQVSEHESYFPSDELMDALKGCQHVALVGTDTDACVQAAAFMLWHHKIYPVILQNHCASSGGPQFHNQALDFMRRQFGVDAIVDSIVPSKLALTLAANKKAAQAGPAF
jgi:nicotinamidase-related amidase